MSYLAGNKILCHGNKYMVVFSVVVPNKGRTTLLYRGVESALMQSFADIEIIIVDDSSDTVYNEIKKHFFGKTQVRVVRGEGKGESWARKRGFELSEGRYIALLDSDDYWESGKLQKHYEAFMSDQRIGVTWDQLININEAAGRKSYAELPRSLLKAKGNLFPPEVIRSELVKSNFIHASCGIVDKRKVESIGGFPPIRPSDYILWLKMSQHFYFSLVPFYMTIKFFNRTSMGMKKRLLMQDLYNSFPFRLRFALMQTNVTPFKKLFDILFLLFLLTGLTIFLKDETRIYLQKKLLGVL